MGFYLDPSTLNLPPGELMWGMPWEMVVEQQARYRKLLEVMNELVQEAEDSTVDDSTPVQNAKTLAENDPTPTTPTNMSSPMFHATPPTVRATIEKPQELTNHVLLLPRPLERSHEPIVHENYGNIIERPPTPPLRLSLLNTLAPSAMLKTARHSSLRNHPPASWDPSLKLPPIISHRPPHMENCDAGLTSEHGGELQLKRVKEEPDDEYALSPESDYVSRTIWHGGRRRPGMTDQESEYATGRTKRARFCSRRLGIMMAEEAHNEQLPRPEDNYVTSSETTRDYRESRKRKRTQESDTDDSPNDVDRRRSILEE
ncbi:hypothetical protein F5B18DRAFT_656649 [Nemania serpens]|nr:hypothetical protein F5B18DRAFT_656649 [Nemania serpens]